MAIPAVGLSVVCLVGFVWAICGQHDGMSAGTRLLSPLSLARFTRAMPGDRRSNSDAASYLLLAASLMLFWLSIGATKVRALTLMFAADVPSFLQHHGPYKYVRQPSYLSYLLFWFGAALASRSSLHWLMPVVMRPVYVTGARREVRKFGGSTLASAYDDYRRRTRMLVPRLWRQPSEIH